MSKYNQSKRIFVAVFMAIFSILFVCNMLTTRCADDFPYCFSFATGERITNLSQIFSSMAAHAKSMNGRVVPHFLVQTFEALPKVFFNVVNSLLFTLQIFLIYIIAVSGDKKKRNNLLPAILFGAIWIFQPAFGQVNLWLDGSCNYMWTATFGLAFLIPYVNFSLYDKNIKNPAVKILYVLFCGFCGAFSENGSSAFVFMAFLLCVVYVYRKRKFPPVYGAVGIIAACIGYVSMFLAPAEWLNKSTQFSFGKIRLNFITCLEVYKSLYILIFVYAAFLAIAIVKKADRKRIALSVIIFLGSLFADFMMVFAAWYSLRSAAYSAVLLTAATAILVQESAEKKQLLAVALSSAVLLVATVYFVLIGVNDIYSTYKYVKQNETYILQCKEAGIQDVTICTFPIYTKYSALDGLKYIDTENPEDWPNKNMAQYFGVNSISGQNG